MAIKDLLHEGLRHSNILSRGLKHKSLSVSQLGVQGDALPLKPLKGKVSK